MRAILYGDMNSDTGIVIRLIVDMINLEIMFPLSK